MRIAATGLLLALVAGPVAEGGQRQADIETLVVDLTHANPSVRARALRALDATDDPAVVPHVAALARDPEDGLQIEAIGATLRLLLGEPVTGRREDPAGALASFDADLAPVIAPPPDAFAHLASAMDDVNADVRRQAAAAFAVLAGRRGSDVPAPALEAADRALQVMLGAPDPATRVTGARVAGRLYRAPFEGAAAVPSPSMPDGVGDALIALLNQPAALEPVLWTSSSTHLRHHACAPKRRDTCWNWGQSPRWR